MKLHRRHENNDEAFGLNTTSTADISFMLLVFFLVTTSMYVDKGLLRHLPPDSDDATAQQEIIVDNENIMSFVLSDDGTTMVNGECLPQEAMESNMVSFLLDRLESHLFTIETAQDCPYEAYYRVQNSINNAYTIAREQLSQQTYHTSMSLLTDDQHTAILSRLPHRVAESYAQH